MYLNVSVPAPVTFALLPFRNVIVAVFAAVQVADFTTTVCETEKDDAVIRRWLATAHPVTVAVAVTMAFAPRFGIVPVVADPKVMLVKAVPPPSVTVFEPPPTATGPAAPVPMLVAALLPALMLVAPFTVRLLSVPTLVSEDETTPAARVVPVIPVPATLVAVAALPVVLWLNVGKSASTAMLGAPVPEVFLRIPVASPLSATPLIFPTVVATLPDDVVTSPVSAGWLVEGRIPVTSVARAIAAAAETVEPSPFRKPVRLVVVAVVTLFGPAGPVAPIEPVAPAGPAGPTRP